MPPPQDHGRWVQERHPSEIVERRTERPASRPRRESAWGLSLASWRSYQGRRCHGLARAGRQVDEAAIDEDRVGVGRSAVSLPGCRLRGSGVANHSRARAEGPCGVAGGRGARGGRWTAGSVWPTAQEPEADLDRHY